MSDSKPNGSGKRRAALIVAESDGSIVEQNEESKRVFGESEGLACWEVVGKRAGGEELGCSPGCVHRIVDAGIEGTRSDRVIVDGKPHQLSCAASGDRTVTILTPLTIAAPEGGRPLSTREIEVLQLLARGMTAPQIAEKLGIKKPTVRTYLEHLRAKLDSSTQAAIVAEGYKRGYLEPTD